MNLVRASLVADVSYKRVTKSVWFAQVQAKHVFSDAP